MTVRVAVKSLPEIRRAFAALQRDLDAVTETAEASSVQVLNDHEDVKNLEPTDAQVLVYDIEQSKWVNQAVDHGTLGGLTDDDHTQYLKEEASGGAASEVPDHTHADGTECGTVDHGALTGRDDDDHTLYSLADGTRAFTGTVGGIPPVVSTDLVTKEYVDTAVGFEFDYYMTDTASDIGGYFVVQNEVGGAESSHTLAAAGTGDDQLIVSYVTPSGEPGVTALSSGVYDGKFQADRTAGTKSVNLYWTLSYRNLAGTETLLKTSELSSAITGRVSVDLHAVLAAEQEILVTDRLVLKIYANVGSTGSAATIVVYQEGTNDSHITVGVESSVLNNIFVRKDEVDDTPVNGVTDAPISSNWAYDHDADVDAHHAQAHKDEHDPEDGADPLDCAAPGNLDGVQASAESPGSVHTFARSDHAHRIQHAIADNAIVTVDDADAADNDYAKFTASGLEGRSYAQVISDLSAAAIAWRTRSGVLYIEDPQAGDEYLLGFVSSAVTFVEVHGLTDVGTVDLNIERRAKTTADQAGTDILDTGGAADPDIRLDADAQATTTFAAAGAVATDQWLVATVSAVASSPTRVWLNYEYTID